MVAEPFLNTSRGVQDLVDGSAECITNSRARLSCANFLSTNALNNLPTEDGDIESAVLLPHNSKQDVDKHKKGRRCPNTTTLLACVCAPLTSTTTARFVHLMTLILSIGIVMIFIYASFAV